MSFVRFAVRVCAVEAIKGRTLALNNVLDSAVDAISVSADEKIRTDKEKPFIAVYTEKSAGDLGGNFGSSYAQTQSLELVFETGITSPMTETDPNTGESVIVGVGVPATDSSREFFLDMTSRQIFSALSDPGNPWSELFRRFVMAHNSIEHSRAGNENAGVKFAAQQTKVGCSVIDEPEPDALTNEELPFNAFLVALETSGNSDYETYANLMRQSLTIDEPDWQALQRRLALSAGSLLSLGYGPIEGDEDSETPPLDTVTTEVDGGLTVEVSDND